MTRAGAALLAALVLLTGCRAEPSSSGAKGTVVDRHAGKVWVPNPKPGRWERTYTITTREDSGKRDAGRVSRSVYERCQIGERWPDCKR